LTGGAEQDQAVNRPVRSNAATSLASTETIRAEAEKETIPPKAARL
jgi:hypothetical protein